MNAAGVSASYDASLDLLMAPALAWLTALMVVPCALVLALAFFRRGIYGGIEYTLHAGEFRAASSIRSMPASSSTRRASPARRR